MDKHNSPSLISRFVNASEASVQESPADFDAFFPWAALKLAFPFAICVTRVLEAPPTPVSTQKMKIPVAKSVLKVDASAEKDKEWRSFSSVKTELNTLNVNAIYHNDDLVHINIDQPTRGYIPREVISLITLIVEFHPYLRRITINKSVDQYVIYELGKLLRVSNITELYLDDTFVKQANYAILFDDANNLQILSLARCKLDDAVVKDIADKLHYPLPASQKLCVLNLSSNFLTNKSAKYLATALRSNRKLCYINLASNMISDEGGISILKVLISFPLTLDEAISFKRRYLDYLKMKQNMIKSYFETLKMADIIADKKAMLTIKKDNKKPPINTPKKYEADNKNALLYEKAEHLVQKSLGQFEDPMAESQIINGWRCCNGNGSLVYLNIAYNTLSYPFLKMLVMVVEYQLYKKIKGLKNIQIDGNPFPTTCTELTQLDSYFDHSITAIVNRRGSTPKTYKQPLKVNKK